MRSIERLKSWYEDERFLLDIVLGEKVRDFYYHHGKVKWLASWYERWLQVDYYAKAIWCRLMYHTVCRWRGCNLVFEDDFTPDYGSESWYCTRCFHSGTIRYF